MTTSTKRIIFQEGKGNQFAETINYDTSDDIVCERLIFTDTAGLADTHSKSARHQRSEAVRIKGLK